MLSGEMGSESCRLGAFTGSSGESKMQFEKRQKSFIPITCMDLRLRDAAALCNERHPPLDGGNLIARLTASGDLWGEVGSRVGFC